MKLFNPAAILRKTILLALLLLCLQSTGWCQWKMKKVNSGAGEAHCILESDKLFGFDGYQDIQVYILVNAGFVLVKTESELDPSYKDIGLQVDKNELVMMDKVAARKSALYESRYANIIEQFRKGSNVRVQLRYWPTWPETGTHSVTYSLFGFGPAYDSMIACK